MKNIRQSWRQPKYSSWSVFIPPCQLRNRVAERCQMTHLNCRVILPSTYTNIGFFTSALPRETEYGDKGHTPPSLSRDVVQPPVFVAAALKRKERKTCSHLVTWRPVAPAGINSGQTQNLCFVDYTKCKSTLLIRIWILAFCLCTALFLLWQPNLTLTLVVSLRSCLPGIARYRRPGDRNLTVRNRRLTTRNRSLTTRNRSLTTRNRILTTRNRSSGQAAWSAEVPLPTCCWHDQRPPLARGCLGRQEQQSLQGRVEPCIQAISWLLFEQRKPLCAQRRSLWV